MSLVGNTSVVVSEVLLSLYPILVKVVPTNFDTGLLARFAVFTAASLIFYSGQTIHLGKVFLYGLVTLFHVVNPILHSQIYRLEHPCPSSIHFLS